MQGGGQGDELLRSFVDKGRAGHCSWVSHAQCGIVLEIDVARKGETLHWLVKVVGPQQVRSS